jgi:hypothetical protein
MEEKHIKKLYESQANSNEPSHTIIYVSNANWSISYMLQTPI